MSAFLVRALLGCILLSPLPRGALLAAAPIAGDASAGSRLTWRYARTPGIEILSTCPDEKTVAFVRGFERAISIVPLPSQFTGPAAPPLQLILADHYLDDTLAPAGAPQELRDMRLGTAGMIYSWTSASGRIVARVGLRDWNHRLSTVELSSLPLRLIPELVLRRDSNPPEWLLEGYREIFSYTGRESSTDEDYISWGPIARSLVNLGSAVDRPENLIPLADLFAEAPIVRSTQDRERWRAEAALFVHWGLFRRDHTAAEFTRFWLRACHEPVNEKLFRECFGLSFNEGRTALAQHLREASRQRHTWKVGPGDRNFALALRDAAPAEIGRITGDWLRMESIALARHPTLKRAFELKCREVLAATAAGGEDDPQWRAVAGLFFRDAREIPAARAHLERAFALGTDDARALRELGRLRLDEACVAPAGPDAKLSPDQTAAILKPLYQARALPPASSATNQLLVRTWAASEAVPSLEQIRDLRTGVTPLLRYTSLAHALAKLAVDAEQPAEAAAIACDALPFVDEPALIPELEKIALLGGR